jgi:hypothetical protein
VKGLQRSSREANKECLAMARMHTLQTIHSGKVVYILLIILSVMVVTDYHSTQLDTYPLARMTDQTDELLHISKIKRGKALSYIENPYHQYDD